MPRIRDIDPMTLTPPQKLIHDKIVAGPRGRVEGPLRVWLANPELADKAQALGAFCRFGSSLPQRLSELAIIVIGAYWRASFEWYAHAPLAIEGGIDPTAVEAIRVGAAPAFSKPDEACVYTLAKELVEQRRISAKTYHDAVALLGYYGLVCMTLVAFEIPLPPGVTEPFPDAA
jgi:4-carboxymuconolactone decarboxylase